MIDKIILGLLTKKKLTTYDIKIAMEKSISKFYSNSFGSINPAIKKLERDQLISCTEKIENSRLKKIYNIEPKGITSYNDWIHEPITQGRLKDDVLIRIFFLGDTNKNKQQSLIEDYITSLNKSKSDLEKTKQEIEKLKLTKDKKKEIKYQLATLQFGLDYLTFKQQWFTNLIANL